MIIVLRNLVKSMCIVVHFHSYFVRGNGNIEIPVQLPGSDVKLLMERCRGAIWNTRLYGDEEPCIRLGYMGVEL